MLETLNKLEFSVDKIRPWNGFMAGIIVDIEVTITNYFA